MRSMRHGDARRLPRAGCAALTVIIRRPSPMRFERSPPPALAMRRTKILATLGPASSDEATVHALIDAGIDAVRLNFSHGTPEGHARALAVVRAAAAARRVTIGVMQDLSGPKLRVGELASPLVLAEGDALTIVEEARRDRAGHRATFPATSRRSSRRCRWARISSSTTAGLTSS